DVGPRSVRRKPGQRAREGEPVVGAAPVVARVRCGVEPEEVDIIDALGDRGAGVGRGASGVAAGVEVEVGCGDGDVPAMGAYGVGELEVARAAAVGRGNGEVVDPEEAAQRGHGSVTDWTRVSCGLGANDGHAVASEPRGLA